MIEEGEAVNKYGRYWIDRNQILNFRCHPGAVIDLEAAKLLVSERILLFNENQYPLLIDTRNLKFISPEALKYISSEESYKLITAGAALFDSFLSRIFCNCFMKLYTPKVPTRIFNNKEEAIKWLLKYQHNEISHTKKNSQRKIAYAN